MSRKRTINPDALVCMNDMCDQYPLEVDLAYARDDNYLFGERIYRADAKLWLHEMLADIIFNAAHLAAERYGMTLRLFDGLRTSDAQARMQETQIVQDNPQWLTQKPQLLSNPGEGGHPRAMAIDLTLCNSEGQELDMGTPFDFLAEDSRVEHNRAHREHQQDPEIQKNRDMLDDVMLSGAEQANIPIFLLPQEWWDYRLPPDIYSQYEPLSDQDLPSDMKLL